MKLHSRLRDLRTQSGLSEADMADHLGYPGHPEIVRAIENGTRNIGVATLEKWARACWCEVSIDFRSVGYRVHDLGDISITAAVRNSWISKMERIILLAKGQFPGMRPEEIPDEQFKEYPDGSGSFSVVIRGKEFRMKIPAGAWEFIKKN